ncbi:hypothetical protein NW762_013086 [Fusarium torreyae]|uniref:Rhodopsin domain-containing protein n=1 Tax=Fusarium torreyae TaxID=1237075 RepID=A0A9W8RMI2_9HYPO|nr:hypothetical protein NW762_013086 [Fusarium torreyae]
MIIITGVVVGLRFYEKLRYDAGPQLEDYVVAGCFLVDLGNSIVCLHGLSRNGLGRDAWQFSPDTITAYLCFLYAGQTLYATDVFVTKICVLLFYLRIFPGVTIRRLIWGTIGTATLTYSPPDEMEEEAGSSLDVLRRYICYGREYLETAVSGSFWQLFESNLAQCWDMVCVHAESSDSNAQSIPEAQKLRRRWPK